ncbi:zinc-binding dehydrogenase [Amycolatopsis speibonae]|uniref:Zinc-binding dehydrogenase n=1 Tax=Amycolatopsis speibonae TaxID=1450224 RepID=A0ABV7P2F2_9PSEU
MGEGSSYRVISCPRAAVMEKIGADGQLPATMRAVRFDSDTGALTVDEVPLPVPDLDEVVVRVVACGVGKYDVNRIEGRVKPVSPVFTPGREAAGLVMAVGERVKFWSPGDRVVMTAVRECRSCADCRMGGGADNCTEPQMMATHYDGAWAEYTVTSATALVAVPDSIPLEYATVLSGAVSTPYGALDTARLRPAEAVGVWGLGSFGTHMVQLARICGASPIVALDECPVARERALKLGADVALDPANRHMTSYIREITKGLGLDVAFDFVGSTSTSRQAREVLGERGRLVMVGSSPDIYHSQPEFAGVRNKQTILSHSGYSVKHLKDLVELLERGRLDVSASITAIVPLEQVSEGLRKVREGDGDPLRLLLRP